MMQSVCFDQKTRLLSIYVHSISPRRCRPNTLGIGCWAVLRSRPIHRINPTCCPNLIQSFQRTTETFGRPTTGAKLKLLYYRRSTAKTYLAKSRVTALHVPRIPIMRRTTSTRDNRISHFMGDSKTFSIALTETLVCEPGRETNWMHIGVLRYSDFP